MSEERLHITFSYSAAGSLKRALELLKLPEEVMALADRYEMGPIDPGDAKERAAWEVEEFGLDESIAGWSSAAAFWERVSTWPGRLVAWMSSRSVSELCGLHELLWRLPPANIHLIDVANADFRAGTPPGYDEREAFAIVREERISELGLINTAVPIDDVSRATFRTRWEQLRQENAPLRVLKDDRLISAPMEYFDGEIAARITDTWQSCARVVGDVMGSLRLNSDILVFTRVLHLMETDEFEGETSDESWTMRNSRIRRRHGEPNG